MTTRHRASLLSMVLCAAVLTGCVAPPPPPPTEGVTLIDRSAMAQNVQAEPPRLSTTATGTLRATLQVHNISQRKLMVEGRAVFTGGGGESVESPTGWQQLFIERDSSAVFQFQSMSAVARGVRVELREGNR